MQARGLTAEDMDNSLAALRAALAEQLNDDSGTAALEYIDQATQALDRGTPGKLDSALDAGIPLDRLALQYVQTVVAGNVLAGMQLVIDEVQQGTTISDAYLRVLLPAQHEVGRLWHLNELSVSEEHLVSYTTQRLMATLSSQAQRKPDNGFTAVAGAVSGNVHDIGIRAISYLLEIEGWRTIYLGRFQRGPRAEQGHQCPLTVKGLHFDLRMHRGSDPTITLMKNDVQHGLTKRVS